MSALQQLIASHSRDISALEQHAQDHDEEVSARKAGDLNEQFQNHIDHITSGAMDLGSASAAWHLGRKIYHKYQDRKAKKGQTGDEDSRSPAQQDAAEDGQGGDASEATQAQAQGAGEDHTSAVQGEGEDPISTEDSFFPDRPSGAGAEGADDIFSSFPDAPTAPTGGISTGTGPAPDLPPKPQQAGTGGDVDAQPQNAPVDQPAQAQPAAGDTTTTVGSDVQSGARTTTGDFNAPGVGDGTGGEFAGGEGDSAQGIVRTRPTQFTRYADQGSDSSARVASDGVDTAGAQIGDESGNSIGSIMRNTVGKAKGAISDGIDAAGNMAKQGISKVGGALKSLVPDSVSDALDTGLITTDAVLDGIPVVGEVASLVTGLVALFEGIGNKPKTADDEEEATQKEAPPTAVSAIDPSSLVKHAAVNVVA